MAAEVHLRPRIFVAIAAYRDPECQWTVRSLFERAAYPERVFIGLCWQLWPGRDAHCFRVETRPSQVRAEAYDARSTRGLGWARKIAHGLRREEELVLQLDSHMRMHEGWDEALVEMLAACPSPKPVLSAYPSAYHPPDVLEACITPRLLLHGTDEHGLPVIRAELGDFAAPAPSVVMAGGFVFARAALWREVPCDPALNFRGEELAFSARAFTAGWDVFAPPRCVVHHYYERAGAPRPWDDAPHLHAFEARSLARVRSLLGVAPEVLAERGGERPLGLGAARSLGELELRSGVRFGAVAPASSGSVGAGPLRKPRAVRFGAVAPASQA